MGQLGTATIKVHADTAEAEAALARLEATQDRILAKQREINLLASEPDSQDVEQST